MNVGQTVGTIGGGIAGQTILGALDGPLPFMDIIGSSIGGAIGGDIGKAIGGKGKKQRMAGDFLQFGGGPKIPRNVIESTPQGQALIKAIELNQLTGGPVSYSAFNPNTQMGGMGIVDPNPSKVLQEYAMY